MKKVNLDAIKVDKKKFDIDDRFLTSFSSYLPKIAIIIPIVLIFM